jgi:hypothetical protein
MSSLNDQYTYTQVITSESIAIAKLKVMGIDAISAAVHAMNSKPPNWQKHHGRLTNVEEHECMILLKEKALDAVHKTALAYTAIQNVVHKVLSLNKNRAARSKLNCEAKSMLKSWDIVLSKVQDIAKVVSYAESDYEKVRKMEMPDSEIECITFDNSINDLERQVNNMYRTWDKFWKTLGCEGEGSLREFPPFYGNMPRFMCDLLPPDDPIDAP